MLFATESVSALAPPHQKRLRAPCVRFTGSEGKMAPQYLQQKLLYKYFRNLLLGRPVARPSEGLVSEGAYQKAVHQKGQDQEGRNQKAGNQNIKVRAIRTSEDGQPKTQVRPSEH